jgi:hypothetical protein
MENALRIKTRIIIKTIMMTALAVVVTAVIAIVELAPTVQIIPGAYAAIATGGSAITEGACSTGTFADDLLASLSSSCGPNSSSDAAGDVAFCTGDDLSISIGIKGTCSTSN